MVLDEHVGDRRSRGARRRSVAHRRRDVRVGGGSRRRGRPSAAGATRHPSPDQTRPLTRDAAAEIRDLAPGLSGSRASNTPIGATGVRSLCRLMLEPRHETSAGARAGLRAAELSDQPRGDWRMADLSPRLNVVLGGDLVSTRDVAGDELALSSVAVGPSACGTAGVKRIGNSRRAPDASPPQRLGPVLNRRDPTPERHPSDVQLTRAKRLTSAARATNPNRAGRICRSAANRSRLPGGQVRCRECCASFSRRTGLFNRDGERHPSRRRRLVAAGRSAAAISAASARNRSGEPGAGQRAEAGSG